MKLDLPRGTAPDGPETRKRPDGRASPEPGSTELGSSRSSKRLRSDASTQDLVTDIDIDNTASSGQANTKHDDEQQIIKGVTDHSIPSTSTGTVTRAAGSKIWYTTELLEQVISYLPGVDVVVVSGVDKTAHNCVANSSLALTKMLFRPSGREPEKWYYCEYRTKSGKISTIKRESFELVPPQNEDPQQKLFTRAVLPVALCPILELKEQRKESALERIQRQLWRLVGGWRETEYANVVGCPPENSRYFDMLLTDPPVRKVEAELTFAHNLYPALMIRAKRTVTQKKPPLTFRTFVGSVRRQSGDVFVHESKSCSMNRKNSINHEISLQVQRHGGYFKLDPEKSFLSFNNIVVPSE